VSGTRLAAALLSVLVGTAACGSSAPDTQDESEPAVTRADPPATATPPPAAVETEEPQAAPAPPPVSDASPPSDPGVWWRPPARTTWQYQLSGDLDASADAAVFDVDWEDTTAQQVQVLHDRGRHVICYVNAGAYEEWRGDAQRYPAVVLGDPLDGWPGERWLDVRRLDVLLPIIASRIDACRAKGFDAVETDNVDGYANDSGFPLSAEDQIAFNLALAGLAHERGLAIGLKNDVEQISALEPAFDFAVNEECLAYDECGAYAPFLRAGKAVLHVEYDGPAARVCAQSSSLGVNTILKDLELGSALQHC
jgi:hypothetical protein